MQCSTYLYRYCGNPLARAQSGPTGLLAGWFIDRFGPRRAVLVGALLSGSGFLEH